MKATSRKSCPLMCEYLLQFYSSSLNSFQHIVTKVLKFICQMTSTSMVQEVRVWGDRVGVGVDSYKVVFLGGPLSVHFCCRMYHLATVHSVTDGRMERGSDRWTDRQTTLSCSVFSTLVLWNLSVPLMAFKDSAELETRTKWHLRPPVPLLVHP